MPASVRNSHFAYYISLLAAVVLSGILLVSISLHASGAAKLQSGSGREGSGKKGRHKGWKPRPPKRPAVPPAAQPKGRDAPPAGAPARQAEDLELSSLQVLPPTRPEATEQGKIHICLCSDDPDLRPAVVCIRSVVASSSNPSRLVFHFVSSRRVGLRFGRLARVHLAGVNLQVHYNESLEERIRGLITFRASSKARKGLASPFNFAPFYLHHFIRSDGPGYQRLIYIDTDTIINGDVGELGAMDLKGHPCGAVKYCLQRFKTYININEVKRLGFGSFDPLACIANRGVLIVDVARWQETRLTQKIEEWMDRYGKAENDIWFGGMSQPPWLLAMNGDYAELGEEWNCNSLGRSSMSPEEGLALQNQGFDDLALDELQASLHDNGAITPHVVLCSRDAKLLHFNGAIKPWLLKKDAAYTLPLCQVPRTVATGTYSWSTYREVHLSQTQVSFVACTELWELYSSHDALTGRSDSPDTHILESELQGMGPCSSRRSGGGGRSKKEAAAAALPPKSETEKEAPKEQEKEKASKPKAQDGNLPGGYRRFQEVKSVGSILVRGKVVVDKGIKGVVQGPSIRHPKERVNVLFSERKDGQARTVNVLPQEIQPLATEGKR